MILTTLKRGFLIVLFLITLFLSCHKKESSIQVTKMNGTWIAIGKAYGTGLGVEPLPPDAFIQIEVKVVNEKAIVIFNDTLYYKSFDTGVLNYTIDNSYSMRANWASLLYHIADNSITYQSESTTSFANVGITVSTSYYKPNPLLKDYLPKIVGVKSLSGIVHDYFIMRNPHDSTFTINVNITFTAINDSTLAFDNDVLKLGDNTLHYKATDYTQKKVIFQNFHSFSYSLSTLTYYYEADSITFEQEFKTAPPQTRSVVLQ